MSLPSPFPVLASPIHIQITQILGVLTRREGRMTYTHHEHRRMIVIGRSKPKRLVEKNRAGPITSGE
jgi:hypothetical protein